MSAGTEAYDAAVNRRRAAEQRRKHREAAQMRAKAQKGCEACLATKDDIRNEQARLRREFYARNPEWHYHPESVA